ncbi:hypothetical protein ISN45_At05g029540 [Arabidopsis thaliana x Arabidopsis arenosa]|uniref:RNase H type-1 domain-containing protein n=1 Tax=Arabidopsis thaliana x Arabidopsis arenosa TaxID=1240361 RepID=A0A8T2CW96_9BRAS|nr:hypothetical protein ISN45_At05g029540 [Arabidopsis thaliana x Arabidopsis arenosa]
MSYFTYPYKPIYINNILREGQSNPEVKFCVDASILYQNVAPYLQKDKKACPTTNSPLAAYIQDIQKLATISASFVVSKVNRTINDVADHLAKVARSKKMQYVISWTHVS